jgi:hypothetical protein
MTRHDFDNRVAALGLTSKALPAAREVLVEGQSMYFACRQHGVGYSTLWQVVTRIRATQLCRECGQEIK